MPRARNGQPIVKMCRGLAGGRGEELGRGNMGTKMTTLRQIAGSMVVAVLGAGFGFSVAGPAAHAQANCEWYAKTALKQQQDNERLKCGFKGDAWNADLKAHAVWCQSVPPDAWKEQAKKRNQELATCAKK